jgi:hypothetical protein
VTIFGTPIYQTPTIRMPSTESTHVVNKNGFEARVSANDILQQLPEPRPSAQDESAHRLVGICAHDYETLGLRLFVDCCALTGQ